MTDRQARSRSFGAWAEAYDRFRPGYPDAIVRRVLALAPPRSPQRVIDIGAGTGLLSRVLLAAGSEVTAIEPDRRMAGVLASTVGAGRAVVGCAEALPLRDGSAEAVLGAQMWHWVDPASAAAEAARVLVPGGLLALLWNVRESRVGWVRELQEELGFVDAYQEFIGGAFPDLGSGFRRAAVLEESFGLPMDADRLVGLLGTYSPLRARQSRSETERQVRRFVSARPSLSGQFAMPFRCTAYVACRT